MERILERQLELWEGNGKSWYSQKSIESMRLTLVKTLSNRESRA